MLPKKVKINIIFIFFSQDDYFMYLVNYISYSRHVRIEMSFICKSYRAATFEQLHLYLTKIECGRICM